MLKLVVIPSVLISISASIKSPKFTVAAVNNSNLFTILLIFVPVIVLKLNVDVFCKPNPAATL